MSAKIKPSKLHKRQYTSLGNKPWIFIVIIAVITVCAVFDCICRHSGTMFRLDQYAGTIFGSVIGVIGTMFGLTAASYAFIWGELKNEADKNARLQHILNSYKKELWNLFFNTLLLTFIIIICNLVLMGFIQQITDTTLFYGENMYIDGSDVIVATYHNEKFILITEFVLIDLLLSITDIILMGVMNYKIFARQRRYEKIAEKNLKSISDCYNLDLPEEMRSKKGYEITTTYDFDNELNKIYYLELVINRILQNHESEGDAFRNLSDNEALLKHIVSVKLENFTPDWEYISNDKKLKNLNELCAKETKEEIDKNNKIQSQAAKEKNEASNASDPAAIAFVRVYSDLIIFRNSQLVHKNENVIGTMLKCTIKKRLLFFLMSHERFDGMDLTNMSLSGADLSYSNFSKCNLKGVKLKGANCRGADFTEARMPGIHFVDEGLSIPKNIQSDDIQITCQDDGKDMWDKFSGKQSTCLEAAAFSNADVSRMSLLVPCEIDNDSPFPFSAARKFPAKDDNPMFSLRDTNFDGAKLFDSTFSKVDLSNSSISGALMFNCKMVLIKSENVNFKRTVLTRSVFNCSYFANSSFDEAIISDCNIYRCNFSNASLSGANLSNAQILLCNFCGAICNNTSFKNISQGKKNKLKTKVKYLLSFRYATMIKADFSSGNLTNADFSHANAINCIFTKAIVSSSNYSYAILSSSIWNMTKVRKTKFTGSVMRDCVILLTEFVDCCFNKTDFSNSIINSKFLGGEMNDVKFCDVKELDPQMFNNIKLNRVDFSGTGVKKNDFADTVIIQDCIFDKIIIK